MSLDPTFMIFADDFSENKKKNRYRFYISNLLMDERWKEGNHLRIELETFKDGYKLWTVYNDGVQVPGPYRALRYSCILRRKQRTFFLSLRMCQISFTWKRAVSRQPIYIYIYERRIVPYIQMMTPLWSLLTGFVSMWKILLAKLSFPTMQPVAVWIFIECWNSVTMMESGANQI